VARRIRQSLSEAKAKTDRRRRRPVAANALIVKQPLRCHCERSEAIHSNFLVVAWIALRSLSSGAHSRDPLARNDGEI